MQKGFPSWQFHFEKGETDKFWDLYSEVVQKRSTIIKKLTREKNWFQPSLGVFYTNLSLWITNKMLHCFVVRFARVWLTLCNPPGSPVLQWMVLKYLGHLFLFKVRIFPPKPVFNDFIILTNMIIIITLS